MAMVMIKCPVTSHAIATGVEVESDGGFNSLLDTIFHTQCPLCGNSHAWAKHDAWVADDWQPVSSYHVSVVQRQADDEVRPRS
jgi:hypothetical protein